MLDINYIRQHPDELKANIKNRGLDPQVCDVGKLLKVDQKRSELVSKIDKLREERNKIANQLKGQKDENLISRGRSIKKEIKEKEESLAKVNQEFKELMDWMPNIVHPKMPIGKDEKGNVEKKTWGEKPQFSFEPKDHLELGEALDLIDVKTAAKVSGSRFYYLKNEAVLLQFAIFNHALEKLVKKGFIPIVVPVLLKTRALYGTGYFPSEEDQIYKLEQDEKIEDQNELFLTGTSEQAIVAYQADQVLDQKELPKKYVGYSSCFRSEAGSWGKDVRGIKRVHQFEKVEMIYFTTPEDSQKYMQEALEIEEEILQELNLPYRVIEMCTGDVGLPTYRKFDVEVWSPAQKEYIEIMSNSDLAAYHARRLNIRYQKGKEKDFVHTISATAIPNVRTIIAILENYQQEDGTAKVPKILQEFMGIDLIKPKEK